MTITNQQMSAGLWTAARTTMTQWRTANTNTQLVDLMTGLTEVRVRLLTTGLEDALAGLADISRGSSVSSPFQFVRPVLALRIAEAAEMSRDVKLADDAIELAEDFLKEHASPDMTLVANCALGLASIVRADQVRAEVALGVIRPHAETLPRAAVVPGRIAGNLMVFLGRNSQAETQFAATEAFCRTAGFTVELALTLVDHADALMRRSTLESETRAQARKLQDEALSIARELGMKPLMERILKRRQILKA
jgi:ATP/maltotriose-dependent transcriptional regulator MalT